MLKNIFKIKNSGFTLIELIVAVSIFTIVVFVGLATFIALSKNQAASIPFDNEARSANLAMELMANKIRGADSISISDSQPDYQLTVSNSGNPKVFTLFNANGGPTLGNTCPLKSSPCFIGMLMTDSKGSDVYRLTSPDVNVSYLEFRGKSSDKPYASIKIVIENRWKKSGEVPLTLSTLAVPLKTNNLL